MRGTGEGSHPWLDEGRDSVFGDSMDWLEEDLESSFELVRARPGQAWAPVPFPPGGEADEPDSLALMEAFLASAEAPSRVQPPPRPGLEAAMASGTRSTQTAPPAPVNGSNGTHREKPGWIYLAVESLANFEALRLRGGELPSREETAPTRG